MARLSYCYLLVFGGDFEVDKFACEANVLDAVVETRNYPMSRPIARLVKKSEVKSWTSSRAYFDLEESMSSDVVERTMSLQNQQEKFLIDFLKNYDHLKDVIKKYRDGIVEVSLVVVYEGEPNERISGVYFGSSLVASLHELGASISTDVIFTH